MIGISIISNITHNNERLFDLPDILTSKSINGFHISAANIGNTLKIGLISDLLLFEYKNVNAYYIETLVNGRCKYGCSGYCTSIRCINNYIIQAKINVSFGNNKSNIHYNPNAFNIMVVYTNVLNNANIIDQSIPISIYTNDDTYQIEFESLKSLRNIIISLINKQLKVLGAVTNKDESVKLISTNEQTINE